MRPSMPVTTDGPHLLVTNQHGDNRGDEAALRAMLEGLTARVPGARFTVVHQYADKTPAVTLPENVELVPMFRSLVDVALLGVYAVLRRVGLRPRFLLTATGRRVVAAYESADFAISAPGGPYFGDLYSNHEIMHWLFVWLALLHDLHIVLYAPSAGPFEHRALNTVRRRLFRRFDRPLCVREPVSAQHLRALLGGSVAVEVTADSAFQQQIPPQRAATVAGQSTEGRLLVAVSTIDFKYPGAADSERRRATYDDAMRGALELLHAEHDAMFLLLPQLYGRVHSDVPYLQRLAQGLPPGVAWEIVDNAVDSDGQRALIGGSDFCIASRYHPQVFSISAGVPSVCIYYEHKALGLMQQVGAGDLALDIRTIERDQLLRAVDEALARRDALADAYREEEPAASCVGDAHDRGHSRCAACRARRCYGVTDVGFAWAACSLRVVMA